MDCTHPVIQVAADACSKLAAMIGRNDTLLPLLVLCGEPGCGKTHLANRMMAWARRESFGLWERGVLKSPLSTLAASWPAICDGFKIGHYGILDDLMRDDFVVIDDIGAEHDPSQNAADKLCQILSRREGKWTIVTTNIAPSSWAARFDARIEDRLLRRSVVVDMSRVPSYATL